MPNRNCAEAFGTFCLVFAGTGAIVINDVSGGTITHVGIAVVFGLVVMAMIHAVGDISGAHLNPAVSLAMWTAGRLPAASVVPYIASQVIGGLTASLLLRILFPEHPTLGATLPAGPASQSFLLEVICTFILMVVILRVSSGSKERGLLAGLTVGGIIGLEAMFAGPISGASMNPARSLAPAIVAMRLADVWIYLVAPVAGALLGVAAYRFLRDDA
jgi:MIP family channel proteins